MGIDTVRQGGGASFGGVANRKTQGEAKASATEKQDASQASVFRSGVVPRAGRNRPFPRHTGHS